MAYEYVALPNGSWRWSTGDVGAISGQEARLRKRFVDDRR